MKFEFSPKFSADGPFGGLIGLSGEPIRNALAQLSK
jgi:hypothetical protein